MKRSNRFGWMCLALGLAACSSSSGNSSAVSAAAATPAGSFTATGNLVTGRYAHTATLLNSGQVLIVGGLAVNNDAIAGNGVCTSGTCTANVFLASAELYDPASGTFAATGTLATGRAYATATLLADGRVLVAGGLGGAGFLASAELYDPSTGAFARAGTMTMAREDATATLLSNGQVLIAGGVSGGVNAPIATASAELYDPVAGQFAATGSMASPRQMHTATLLEGGDVLIAGGDRTLGSVSGDLGALPSAELYDPVAGVFSATGNMTVAREMHTATLLANGKVLVAGGTQVGSSGGILGSAELYDPAAGTFTATGSMATPRDLHSATLLANGEVLMAGGFGSGAPPTLETAELYDATAGTFSAAGDLTTPRAFDSATLLKSGEVLIAGGALADYSGIAGADATFTAAELYVP